MIWSREDHDVFGPNWYSRDQPLLLLDSALLAVIIKPVATFEVNCQNVNNAKPVNAWSIPLAVYFSSRPIQVKDLSVVGRALSNQASR